MSTPDAPVPKSARVLLVALAAAMTALALYQWAELFTLARGGKLTCSVSANVDCAVVWKSEFANLVRQRSGVPVAGLGVAWGLTALALSGLLWRRSARGAETHVLQAAVRLWAILGGLSCITFAVASFRIGALCLTCLATYGLTIGFLAVALFMLPDPVETLGARLRSALGTLLLVFAPAYLLALAAATQTPHAEAPTALAAGGPTPAGGAGLFDHLRPEEREGVAWALAAYKQSPLPDTTRFPVRLRKGPADAPVRIVEFTDVMCPHCASLVQQLEELERAAPKGSISIEARQFPLDNSCNKLVSVRQADDVRCVAAKAMVCLESAPDFWELRSKIFEAQRRLTSDLVLELASSGSMKRDALVQCMALPQTQEKLDFDQNYAKPYTPEGTPILIVNGHATAPSLWFLYGLAVAKGDIEAPWFKVLPPAQPPRHDHPH